MAKYCIDCKEKIHIEDFSSMLKGFITSAKKQEGKTYVEYEGGTYRCAACVLQYREELKVRRINKTIQERQQMQKPTPKEVLIQPTRLNDE